MEGAGTESQGDAALAGAAGTGILAAARKAAGEAAGNPPRLLRGRPPGLASGALPVDLLVQDDRIVIRADMPGILESGLDIRAGPNLVEILGWPPGHDAEDGADFFYRERRRAILHRTLFLPEPVLPEGLGVALANGVLEITLPRR